MTVSPTMVAEDPGVEIAALVRTLHETQQRLQELAGGEVDAVIHPGGQSYLLHEAQEKLRQSEMMQRDFAATQSSILNALPAHIALLDHEGAILSVNDGWRRFAESNGLDGASACLGENYLDVCDGARGDCAVEAQAAAAGIRAVLGGGAESFSLEYACHSPSAQHWFRLRVNPLENGGPRGAVVMHLDITESKELAQQILRSQRMESIGTLAGGIAHDLNNALAPIVMSIDLLKLRLTDTSIRELLGVIGDCAERATDMVRQVLSFARGFEGRRMEVRMEDLVKDIERTANDTFLKNITVRTQLARDLWPVVGDSTQLHQILLNLAINARDAMSGGGTLTISAENMLLGEQEAARVPELEAGPYVLLEVADTGTGMTAMVIEKIFDPFFTTKEVGKGTGLGLSTTLGIVRSHGGHIRVTSVPGKGTKFQVFLPAQIGTTAPAPPTIKRETPQGEGELILVIDDEAIVRQITRRALETYGYRVLLARDGPEAVTLCAERGGEIAAVITDMAMPNMDGAETIHALHRMRPDLPIIVTSGLSTDAQIASATSLGVKHFLPKPYTVETLIRTLREVLPH